jgi:hypothetical protein
MRWLWRRRREVLHPPGRGMVYADLVTPLPEAVSGPAVRRPVPVPEDGR